MFELPEGNELHNVPFHVLFEFIRVQRRVICIQHFHTGEVLRTHTHYYYRQGQGRATNDLVYRFLEVVYDTVR